MSAWLRLAQVSSRLALGTGGIAGLLSVGLGAYGSHGLKNRVLIDAEKEKDLAKEVGKDGRPLRFTAEDRTRMWNTANQYHMFSSVALLALSSQPASSPILVATILFLSGSSLFCGSLYRQAFTGKRIQNSLPIAPLGGMSMMAAWLVVAISAFL